MRRDYVKAQDTEMRANHIATVPTVDFKATNRLIEYRPYFLRQTRTATRLANPHCYNYGEGS